ncbi:copper resistance protein CopC/CopD [Paenibacillus pasadenensis]|uniref:copper resistance CopC/CopD family protein n=1 Tax=Paenibacillus pasadenensis TaxID=217090 RepID=UPI00203F6A84|nr:copper resistance protein CopC [Paenibacillus pasadenensis]MCM3746800.1 copper resistance protein CopC/CopD [Paenibacillus pasadenensis]
MSALWRPIYVLFFILLPAVGTASGAAAKNGKRALPLLLALIAALPLLLSAPGQLSAHAALRGASPEAGSRLEASPAEVKLTFNERIESAAARLEVLDKSSSKVTDDKPKLSEDKKSMALKLPALDKGVYTVNYRILSEDGHTVKGSHTFEVLKALPTPSPKPTPVPSQAPAKPEAPALESALPAAGARLDAPPAEVRLTFNKEIKDNGKLEVLDAGSSKVTDAAAAAGGDKQSLTLQLPALGKGVYTVNYKVETKDGEPLSGSHVFVVGEPAAARDASTYNVHAQLGHSGHEDEGLTTESLILYAVRFLYYAGMMLAAGCALWQALYRSSWSGVPQLLRGRIEKIPPQALVLVTLLYVFVESQQLMQGLPPSEWLSLFTGTSVGQGYLALLLLAFAGLALPPGKSSIHAVWALLLLAVEAWKGHSAAASPRWAAVALDYVHLAGAALWAGGLMLLLIFWYGERKEAGRFAASFSRAAWISIVVLTLSGIALTLLYVTRLDYLLLTAWGILLLVKAGLVILVAITAFLLRRRMKRSGFPGGALLKLDAALMALILVIVGVFTYVSPLPANQPVAWHKMGAEMHVSIRISPNVPGSNEFTVRIWMFKSLGDPKSVKLRLISEDKPELGAIDVPVKLFTDDEISTFDGYLKTSYRTTGTYLPFAGRWTAEVRTVDEKGKERVERVSFRNY